MIWRFFLKFCKKASIVNKSLNTATPLDVPNHHFIIFSQFVYFLLQYCTLSDVQNSSYKVDPILMQELLIRGKIWKLWNEYQWIGCLFLIFICPSRVWRKPGREGTLKCKLYLYPKFKKHIFSFVRLFKNFGDR